MFINIIRKHHQFKHGIGRLPPWSVYGYVVGDVNIKLRPPSEEMKLCVRRNFPKVSQPKRVGSFGNFCLIDSHLKRPLLVPFIAHPSDLSNKIAACVHRFGCSMPQGDRSELSMFEEYACAFICRNFTPLIAEDVPDFHEWLKGSSYSSGRQEYLRVIRNGKASLSSRDVASKSFIKWESYEEYKAPRAINSPDDFSKALLGPLVSASDKKTFKSKWFVKGTDPKDWPRKLRDLFGDSPVMETDFSSFEAHHRHTMSHVVKFWLMHMIRSCGVPNHLKRMICYMILGSNVTKFQGLTAKISYRLMSGAMWTSSSNGVLNLLILSYLTLRTKYPNQSPYALVELVDTCFTGVVEGDDGLCKSVGIPPVLIERLGLRLDMVEKGRYTEAGFCGIVCDEDTLTCVRDPKKVLRSFFLMPEKYASAKESVQHGLLRAKALSYKYNFNNCPIIGELCHMVCNSTRSLDPSRFTAELGWAGDHYLRESQALKMWRLPPIVSRSSRLLVEKHFNITVHEQLRIEAVLRAHVGCGRVLIDLSSIVSDLDFKHALRYAVEGRGAPPRPSAATGMIADIMYDGLDGDLGETRCIDAQLRNFKPLVPFDVSAYCGA